MEYSLQDLIAVMIKRLVLIVLCTSVGLVSFYIMNTYMTKPIYTAYVQLYVNPNEAATADINELNYAQKVINTYVHFLRTKTFFRQVIEEGNLNYSPEALQGMTVIDQVGNTEIFQISVSSISAADSYRIVEAMQIVAPQIIKEIKQTAIISVVDPVTMPLGPSANNVMRNTILGGMLGFLLAAFASFVWELVDVNVKSKEELLRKYSLPVLGTIPNYNEYRQRFKFLNNIPPIRKLRLKGTTLKGVDSEKKFAVHEAYNEFRANLRFTVYKNECKKLIISSPVPEDGKSTTSSNIAISIAQTGAKVLLIDCDLRKGKIHNIFNLKSVPGLSDVLSGMASDDEILLKTKYENLRVIPLGVIPPNPTELLGSASMEELIKRMEKKFDYIIIDSPPVNVVSDVLSLVGLVDGIVIVVREGITSHPNIFNALTKYKLAEANILGFVINGISLNQSKKSRSRHYYYKK
ncbi:MAG: polysaccharide biosynthesis tyrosine autokinase [Mobilitalea sp.]